MSTRIRAGNFVAHSTYISLLILIFFFLSRCRCLTQCMNASPTNSQDRKNCDWICLGVCAATTNKQLNEIATHSFCCDYLVERTAKKRAVCGCSRVVWVRLPFYPLQSKENICGNCARVSGDGKYAPRTLQRIPRCIILVAFNQFTPHVPHTALHWFFFSSECWK